MMDKAALLREMKRNNCSVDELARVCGISRSAIYRRLRGEIDFKVGEIIKATVAYTCRLIVGTSYFLRSEEVQTWTFIKC